MATLTADGPSLIFDGLNVEVNQHLPAEATPIRVGNTLVVSPVTLDKLKRMSPPSSFELRMNNIRLHEDGEHVDQSAPKDRERSKEYGSW